MSEANARAYVAFDLETTGLIAESDRVVEVGAVRFDAMGQELGRFCQLVNPERPMSPSAQAIHGISDADLADAPLAIEVLPQFLNFLGDASSTILLAHNATFDAGFLGHELVRAGLECPKHSVVDTLDLARRQLPSATNHRLETIAGLLGLDLAGAHRAMADCLRVKGLWLQLFDETIEPSLVAYPIFDPRRPLPPPNGWELLSDAVASRLRVRLEYTGGSRGTSPRDVTPLGFAHRGGVAYLVAYCHLDSFEKSFRLDRVLRYEVVTLS